MIYDIIKTYGQGKGESTMWKSVKVLSESLARTLSKDEYAAIERDIYASMAGGHYNEEYARCDVKKMYYTASNGVTMHAPYWGEDEVKAVYESVKGSLPGAYGLWDFYVAINMVKSDHCNLFRKWWPNASDSELEKRIVEATVNYLNDEDNPYGDEKVWWYLNPR